MSFLHRNKIYHSHISLQIFIFTANDNLKISDFGIAVESQLQTKSSATSSHFQGDFHYMSPECLQGADRSDANDIWSRTGIKPSRVRHTALNEYFPLQTQYH